MKVVDDGVGVVVGIDVYYVVVGLCFYCYCGWWFVL